MASNMPQDVFRRNADLIGESSQSGIHLFERDNIPEIVISKRESQPVPVSVPLSVPQPTQAPTKRSVDEPERLRIRADDFAQRLAKKSRQEEYILGPFFARDQADVANIKREIINRRRRGEFRNPSVGFSNIQNLEKRSSSDDMVEWELARRDSYHQIALEKQTNAEIEKRQSRSQERCFVGNEQLSCYPTAGTDIVQGQWSKFIWNSNYPLFAQAGYVDVYLFQEDTDRLVTSWTSQNNGAGRLSFQPQDSWWQGRPAADNIAVGQNISWPFYFVVLAAGTPLTGTTSRLATWTAVQTAVPVAVAASRSAASESSVAAASSLSAALESAASLSSVLANPTATGSAVASAVQSSLSQALGSSLRGSGLTGTETLAGTTTITLPNGSVITARATAQANGGDLNANRNSNGLSLPTYAIVLISVLGFLALVLAIAGIYFLLSALRKRRQRQTRGGSFGSRSPIMTAVRGSVASTSADGGYGGDASHTFPDISGGAGLGVGAATTRSAQSEESHPLTSDEASRMADAFRNALRRPEFTPTGLDESPAEDGEGALEDVTGHGGGSRASELLREELAAEGKDLRSVEERKKATFHDD